MSKDTLRKKFSSEPGKYYKVKLFEELDFKRKRCKCGKFFWTLSDATFCPDQPCQKYDFIGKRIGKKMDYVKTWKAIERFFVKNKHSSIPSYPVVSRWFPGLYFTVASVVAFQRYMKDKTVFELPENPLIIPQQCLRFNDIPNVGVTGRHLTSFVMVGQHAIQEKKKGYWKDRCIELDYNMLTKVFKIKPEDINFLEEVWLGAGAFGSSLEYFVRGLELGNAVFTEYLGTPDDYTKMGYKFIDMGAGLERFTWLTNGTPTCYDAVFGPVISKLKRKIVYDKDFILKYAKIAGNLNMDEVQDYRNAKKSLAAKLSVSPEKLAQKTSALEAIYSIADHTKTLLFAVNDGLLPSNVGGGYNVRVVLRRAISFIEEHNLDIDIFSICKAHAQYLRKMNRSVMRNLDILKDVIDVEKEKFENTKSRGTKIIDSIVSRNIEIDNDKLSELYESHGITPELIEKVVKNKNKKVKIPEDFYKNISEKHLQDKKEKKIDIDLGDLPPTKILFYDNENKNEFTATVAKVIKNKFVVLDKTFFYPRGGGQEPDIGLIQSSLVYDVEKIGDSIVHFVDNPSFREGDIVRARIDRNNRNRISRHHTAVHIVNFAARKVLGKHIWQAGAHKTSKKSHIDITHYKPITNKEIEKIEKLANRIVKKHLRVKKKTYPRVTAEKKFGMMIYQGGAVPDKNLRIIEIPGVDVEACSGIHVSNTKELGEINIVSSERISDGIVRLTIVSGDAAREYEEDKKRLLRQIEKILGVKQNKILDTTKKLFELWKHLRKSTDKAKQESAQKIAEYMKERIVKNVLVDKIHKADMKTLQKVSRILSRDNRVIVLFGLSDKIYVFASAGEKTDKNAGEIVKAVCESLSGRGGGIKQMGRGIGSDKDELDAIIKKLWRELVIE